MDNELKKFLGEYFDKPEVIDTKILSADITAVIPEVWAEIFKENDSKIERTINLFRAYL